MNRELALRLFRHMHHIRAVEEEIARHYPEGKMRCPVHLSIGQEAVPALFAEHVRHDDFAVSTHRGHAHYLAKGGKLAAMLAEIYGKATGCSNGKGGSMHLIDLDVNFMGTSAIVGNSIPVGVGLALSSQLQGDGRVSCVFLGDGAIEEGVFYESANFAAVRKLPVLFICENNRYSVYSPLQVRQPAGRSIAALAAAIGVTSASGDAHDLPTAEQIMQRAFDHVRSGGGPYLVEFSTYRWREHCGHAFDDELGYRPPQELARWRECDPHDRLDTELSSTSPELAATVAAIKAEIAAEIDTAFAYAETSPFPSQGDAYQGVYA